METPPASDPVEAGRLLFARPWDFWRGAPALEHLPPMEGLEIAFAGRSNVGKSSLINALTGRSNLARTSNTPGRTQELNFFRPGGVDPDPKSPPLVVVDMPGYGFAEAPESKVKTWTRLIHDYLRGRRNLLRVYLLIDARHGLKPNDVAILDLLDAAAVSYQIVLTKADQVKPGPLERLIAKTGEAIKRRPAAFPVILATSSRSDDGVAALRAAVAALLAERGG